MRSFAVRGNGQKSVKSNQFCSDFLWLKITSAKFALDIGHSSLSFPFVIISDQPSDDGHVTVPSLAVRAARDAIGGGVVGALCPQFKSNDD